MCTLIVVFLVYCLLNFQHLTDIRSTLCNDPIVMFIIEFHFEPNEFFSNTILTKTYFLNCLPDVDDPLSYDGAEIYKCEGCKIDWKQSNSEKEKKCMYKTKVDIIFFLNFETKRTK